MKNSTYKILFNFFFVFYTLMVSNLRLYAFDPTKLQTRTEASRAGGGYTSFRWAPKDSFDVIPLPDPDNSGKISNDYILKPGKDWIYIYTDDKEFDFNEDPAETGDGYTSVLTGFCLICFRISLLVFPIGPSSLFENFTLSKINFDKSFEYNSD